MVGLRPSVCNVFGRVVVAVTSVEVIATYCFKTYFFSTHGRWGNKKEDKKGPKTQQQYRYIFHGISCTHSNTLCCGEKQQHQTGSCCSAAAKSHAERERLKRQDPHVVGITSKERQTSLQTAFEAWENVIEYEEECMTQFPQRGGNCSVLSGVLSVKVAKSPTTSSRSLKSLGFFESGVFIQMLARFVASGLTFPRENFPRK